MRKETKSDLRKQIEKQQETIINLQHMVTRRLNVIRDESRVELAEEIKRDAARYRWLQQKTADLFMVTYDQMDEQIDRAML